MFFLKKNFGGGIYPPQIECSLKKNLLIVYFRIDYIGLGDCPTWLSNWPPAGARNRREACVKKNEETPLKERCHKRDYTPI